MTYVSNRIGSIDTEKKKELKKRSYTSLKCAHRIGISVLFLYFTVNSILFIFYHSFGNFVDLTNDKRRCRSQSIPNTRNSGYLVISSLTSNIEFYIPKLYYNVEAINAIKQEIIFSDIDTHRGILSVSNLSFALWRRHDVTYLKEIR